MKILKKVTLLIILLSFCIITGCSSNPPITSKGEGKDALSELTDKKTKDFRRGKFVKSTPRIF